jgi:hypothetical protein
VESYSPGGSKELRRFFLKRDLISRRSSPVRSLWSNVRHVPRSRLSYSIGTPVEAASAAFRAEMSAGGASVFWMASSITWSIVFAGPTEGLDFGTARRGGCDHGCRVECDRRLRRSGSEESQKLGYVCFGRRRCGCALDRPPLPGLRGWPTAPESELHASFRVASEMRG